MTGNIPPRKSEAPTGRGSPTPLSQSSPDSKPIEHLWKELEKRLARKKAKNASEEFDQLKEERTKIPQPVLNKLIDSMPGATPAIVRGALVTSGDVGAYDFCKRFILNTWDVQDTRLLHVVTSLCSGLVAAVVGAPADVVMTRTLHQRYSTTGESLVYVGAWDTVKKSVKNEGILSLYKGFVPLYVKCGPWALIFWVSYEQIEKTLGGTGW